MSTGVATVATGDKRNDPLARQIRMGLALRGWWLREMVTTPSPLTERMTLFWHNHFVSAQPKASVLENWWQLPSERVLRRRFEPLRFINT